MTRRSDAFPRVSWRGKGYSPKQVKALLDLVEASLADGSGHVSAGEIRRAGFEVVRRGYDVGAVDAALDALEEEILLATARTLAATGSPAAKWELETIRRQLDAPAGTRFPRVSRRRRGHDATEVDVLLDRIATFLSGGAEVTVSELRAASFEARRGGYDQGAVDHLLDRLIELLLASRASAPGAASSPATREVRAPFRPAAPRRKGRIT